MSPNVLGICDVYEGKFGQSEAELHIRLLSEGVSTEAERRVASADTILIFLFIFSSKLINPFPHFFGGVLNTFAML